MGKILNSFLNDHLILDKICDTKSRKDTELNDKTMKKRKLLESKLDEEQKELLEDLIDDIHLLDSHYAEFRQEAGFCLGAMIMSEVYGELKYFDIRNC